MIKIKDLLIDIDLFSPGTVLKAVSSGEEVYMDEEGRHLIFRNIKGKVVPMYGTTDDFVEYLIGKGIQLDPTDQETLRKVDNDLFAMGTWAQRTGVDLAQLHQWYEQGLKDKISQEQMAEVEKYDALMQQRRALAQGMRSRLVERLSEELGLSPEEYISSREELLSNYADEGVVPVDRTALTYKGWDSLVESNTDSASINTLQGQALRAFDLVVMRILDAASNGVDISGETLDDVVNKESNDHEGLRKFFNSRYLRQYFNGDREAGYLVMARGLEIIKHNLDQNTAAGRGMREEFSKYVQGISRDFPPGGGEADTLMGEGEDATLSDFSSRLFSDRGMTPPAKVPNTYAGEQESKALRDHALAGSRADRRPRSNAVVTHLAARLVSTLQDPVGFAKRFESELRIGTEDLDFHHKQGWGSFIDRVKEGDEMQSPRIIAALMTEVAEEALEKGSPAAILRGLQNLARLQGSMDAAVYFASNPSEFKDKRSSNYFKTKRPADGYGNRLSSKVTDMLYGETGDIASRIESKYISNTELGIQYMPGGEAKPTEDKSQVAPTPTGPVTAEGAKSPPAGKSPRAETPPMDKVPEGNEKYNASNMFGFSRDGEVRGKYNHSDSGYSVDFRVNTDDNGGAASVSGEGPHVAVLTDPSGNVLSAHRYSPSDMSRGIRREGILGKLWERMEVAQETPVSEEERRIVEEEGAPDMPEESVALNPFDATFRLAEYNSMDSEGKALFDRLREELAHYPDLKIRGGGNFVTLSHPDDFFSIRMFKNDRGTLSALLEEEGSFTPTPIRSVEALTKTLQDYEVARQDTPVETSNPGVTGLPGANPGAVEAIAKKVAEEEPQAETEETTQDELESTTTTEENPIDYTSLAQAASARTGFSQPVMPGQEAPSTGYMVSDGSRERSFAPNELTPEAIQNYVNEYRDGLTYGDYLGGWFNQEDGRYYLDISRNVQDRAEAEAQARERGEFAIYDVASGTEIAIDQDDSDDGETTESAPEPTTVAPEVGESGEADGPTTVSAAPPTPARRTQARDFLEEVVSERYPEQAEEFSKLFTYMDENGYEVSQGDEPNVFELDNGHVITLPYDRSQGATYSGGELNADKIIGSFGSGITGEHAERARARRAESRAQATQEQITAPTPAPAETPTPPSAEPDTTEPTPPAASPSSSPGVNAAPEPVADDNTADDSTENSSPIEIPGIDTLTPDVADGVRGALDNLDRSLFSEVEQDGGRAVFTTDKHKVVLDVEDGGVTLRRYPVKAQDLDEYTDDILIDSEVTSTSLNGLLKGDSLSRIESQLNRDRKESEEKASAEEEALSRRAQMMDEMERASAAEVRDQEESEQEELDSLTRTTKSWRNFIPLL